MSSNAKPTGKEKGILISMDQLVACAPCGDIGFCLACGEMHVGLEPDAEDCECESCSEFRVWEAGKILISLY